MCTQTRPRFGVSSERAGDNSACRRDEVDDSAAGARFNNNNYNDNKINKNDANERCNSMFFTTSLRRELFTTRTLKWPGRSRVQITCNTSGAYHVQHVVCHVVQRDSSGIQFDRAETAFTLALLYWLNH